MTRQDYVRIAAALASTKPPFSNSPVYDARIVQWVTDRAAIADVFEQDNPLFDRARFYEATDKSSRAHINKQEKANPTILGEKACM